MTPSPAYDCGVEPPAENRGREQLAGLIEPTRLGAGPVAGRVLMLTPDVYYLDRRIVQEAGSLASRGYQVDIFLTNPAFSPADATLPPLVRILPNPNASRPASGLPLRLRYLKAFLSEASPSLHRLADWAQHVASDRAGTIARGNIKFLSAQPRYDLVFGHDVPVWPLAARLKDEWACPVIFDLHDIYPEMEESFSSATARRYWRSVESGFIHRADSILCVNDAVRDYVDEHYRPTAGLFVLSNAVPYVPSPRVRQDRLRELYGIPEDTKVMLFAGVPRPNMNLENLVIGFDLAALEGWTLAFLGIGPSSRTLERLVKNRRLERRIFLGVSVPQAELVATAAGATVGVLPYQAVGYNHLIATPNKLFEYIQARLPILASPLPMVRALIESYHIGGFADFTTPQSSARDIRRFVEDTLPSVSHEALEVAARTISWEDQEVVLVEAVDAARGRLGTHAMAQGSA
jgi:glycosyltransferase involved in cell wall biosynthesis